MKYDGKKTLITLCVLLVGVLLFAACGKEEKAAPTAAAAPKAAGGTTTSATAPAGGTAAATPAQSASKLPLPNWESPAFKKLPPKIQEVMKKYHPNLLPTTDKKPVYGGTVHFTFGTPTTWDIINSNDTAMISFAQISRNSLTKPALNTGDDMWIFLKPEADLAESWKSSGDGTVWTFNLFKNIKWQNVPPVNGREFTAEDAKYALDVYRQKSIFKAEFDEISSVETPDKYTLVIKTSVPYPDLPIQLMGPKMQFMPKECAENADCMKNNPVGAGPFILKEYAPNVKTVFRRNPDFHLKDKWGQQFPYVDEVEVLVITDPAQITAGLRTGQLDQYGFFGRAGRGTTELDDLLKTNANMRVFVSGRTQEFNFGGGFVLFHPDKAPWNDVRVRRAASMAIDRKSMIDGIWGGIGVPMSVVPFWHLGLEWDRPIEDFGQYMQYNPDAAKKLLAEAGYSGGININVLHNESSGPFLNQLLLVQEQWKKAGINMTLTKATDTASYYGRLFGRTYEDGIHGSIQILGTRQALSTWNLLHSKGVGNYSNIKDPTLDDLLDKARYEMDQKKRQGLLSQVVTRFEDQVWEISLLEPYRFEVWQPWFWGMGGTGDYAASGFGARVLYEAWIDPTLKK